MNRKVLKSFFISVLFLAFLWILPNLVDAAYISITPSTKSASPGQQVSLKISSDCTGKVSLSASNGSVSTGSIWVEGTTSATVTVGSSGTTTISAKATDMSDSAGNAVSPSGSTSITISTGNNGTTSTGDKQGASSTTKSNVATLSNLGIKPNDFTGFNKNKTSYNVEVPYETEKVSVYATAANNGKVTSGTGNKTLQVGANAVNVVVTAEDGKTTKTYTLNIVRKEQEVKEENTISEGNVVENIENNIDANTLLEGNVENSIEEPSNDVSNQLLISTKDDSKINKKLISDCIIGVAFAIIILLLIIYYTTQYNKDEDFEEQEDNTNSVEPEEEKSKKEEINKEANKNETINVDIEVPKKHSKGKRFK